MDNIDKNKLVLIGAGKIGRSFIGQLFSTGGYEVVFVDVNLTVINALNERGEYNVIIKSEKEEVISVRNVRGVHSDDREKIVTEIASAGILAISVGIENLENVFPLIADGLVKRQSINNNYALDIIIAENMRDADDYFYKYLKKLLPPDYPLNKLVGLIETSIGKMVPLMTKRDLQNDLLQVYAEPYNTLILNKKGFKNPIPGIRGLAPKNNMKAWVDRKLFIHNLGHSAAAYIGYLYNPEAIYLYEVLSIPEVIKHVRTAMYQSAAILNKKYPEEFTSDDLKEHIEDLLKRFQNKALGDTIYRVGCDLSRKLGSQDRLAGAVKEAIELNLPFDKILFALICGCHFRAGDENGNLLKGDTEFAKLYKKGLNSVLSDVCGFDYFKNPQVYQEAINLDKQINLMIRD